MRPQSHFVLLIDLVKSRNLPDRDNATTKLKQAMTGFNQGYRQGLFAPLEITRGDEAAAVLKNVESLYPALVRFTENLRPFECRIVVTYGELTAGLISKKSAEIDGPAFYQADDLMEDLKKSNRIFALRTGEDALDAEISGLVNLLLFQLESMTALQREVVDHHRRKNRQREIAKSIRRTQQQVSDILRRVRSDILEDAETVLEVLMKKLQAELREGRGRD